MNCWTINFWEINSKYKGPDSIEYINHIDSIEFTDPEKIIIFSQTEWEFYNIPHLKKIIDKAKKIQKKIIVVVAIPNINIVNLLSQLKLKFISEEDFKIFTFEFWGTNFFREMLRDTVSDYKVKLKQISSLDDILMNYDNLTYKHHFVYLNKNPHVHRCKLVDIIAKHDLIKYSAMSWHHEPDPNHYKFKYYDGKIRIIDERFSYQGYDQCWMPNDYYSSFFQLVSESTDRCIFITEKTSVPLFIGKPFIIAGGYGIHDYLISLGFKLYDELFDYSFDNEPNSDIRYEMIAEQIKKITNVPLNNLISLNKQVQQKATYNRKIFLKLVYDESKIPTSALQLIKYYQQTGRVVDKWLIDTHIELENIKKRFNFNYE